MQVLLDTGKSSLILYPEFTSNLNLDSLEFQIEPEIFIFGRPCNQKRDVAFYSNDSKGYFYSGRMMNSVPLTEDLEDVMAKVNKYCGTKFNGILANRYKDGTKYISAHSDDESNLSNGIVASLSYGATRKFRIRNKKDNKIILDVNLSNGSLLLMKGDFQKEFKHEIPVQKLVKDERISLTFRQHSS